MLMAEDSSNWNGGGGAGGFSSEDFDGEDMSIDLDTFYRLLEEEPQSCPEGSSLGSGLPAEADNGAGYREDSQLQNGSQVLEAEPSPDLVGPRSWNAPYSTEALDSRAGAPGGSFYSAGDHPMFFDYKDSKPPAHTGSSAPWHPPYVSDSVAGGSGGSFECGGNPAMCSSETYFTERVGISQPTSSTNSSFEDGHTNHASDHGDFNVPQGKADVAGVVDSEYSSQNLGLEYMDMSSRQYGTLEEHTTETLGPSENNSSTSMEMPFLDVDIGSPHVASTESTICQNSDLFSDHYTAPDGMNLDNTYPAESSIQFSPYGYYFPSNNGMMTNVKDESVEFQDSSCSSSRININCQEGTTGYGFDPPVIDASDMKDWSFDYGSYNGYSAVSGNSSLDADSCPVDNKASVKPLGSTETYMSNKRVFAGVKDEKVDKLVAPSTEMFHSFSFMDDSRKPSYSAADDTFFDQEPKLSGYDVSTQPFGLSGLTEEDMIETKRSYYSESNKNRSSLSHTGGGSINLNRQEHQLPASQPLSSNKNRDYSADRLAGERSLPKNMGFPPSKVSPESIHSNFSEKSPPEDDCDLCIIEDLSDPAPTPRLPVVSNTHYSTPLNHTLAVGSNIVTSQQSSDHDTDVGGVRFRTRDEQLILRVALQDLSQPKSEAFPPDGVLTVPLLRHQRIALSWMVQKETASLHCSGGILADDQGLGKTISTIALILKERPPASEACQDEKKCKLETLDLDKDDDKLPEVIRREKDSDAHSSVSNETSDKSMKTSIQTKGRQACGTLVVCPTSVLRQWAEELHNKVTEKGKLSVLVYHGGNRTRDPCELAKYDVVLTTYSIVSMEVPKQPLADEDEEKAKREEYDSPHMGFSTKKRKYPGKSSKGKKGLDSAALESLARPLGKVGWFRVVLDEAQSIKNHRTQVARACWGLRAKRRWCLSGTPIQNAIDDLYSYFRFLRYDPYAAYKTFCATIKFPISKNPTKGYRKLQAVLKTIMLRRTKGTRLDGEPIISLPPKFIELKRVEFSAEERDFYSRLESDSRAQFDEYAAAGTVKQNYVNILLMLLRLRQACDHPLLVRRYESQSLWKSSVEKAKKLPHDKQESLLRCLEGSLAICGICNDAPEDAVVSECGHVFCSQCIGDYLTGDDNQCPNASCKVRLNVSSVFSKATLNSSLSDQPSQAGMDSEVFDAVESFYEDSSFNSSKIKAALEVLCSMCKPKICTTVNNSKMESVDINASCSTSDVDAIESLEDCSNGKNLGVDKVPKKVEKVVREKAIVFSQWTRMLDLLEACLKTSGLEYRRLDGTMSVVARDKAVKDFNTLPEVSVMIMSLKAASLGLNMVAACHVLLLDLWWNPTTEDQAIDRAHRIGQTRPVTVLRLTVRDTVEDRILALQEKKREMVASAFGEDETGACQTRLTVDDLKYLFMK